MPALGMRHVALNVKDPQKSKDFYVRVLRMRVAWEPDSDNVYLSTDGQDNIALHKTRSGSGVAGNQLLDHIGFFVSQPEELDEWYNHALVNGAKITREIASHRDASRSFYLEDPDGISIQILFHPQVAKNTFS